MPRSRAQIEGLFDGLDLLPPGLVDISHWPGPDPGGAALHFYGGVAVKPAGLPVSPRSRRARPVSLLSRFGTSTRTKPIVGMAEEAPVGPDAV